ncbi:MAG: repair photolyase [Rhodospirillales bacterium]|nr:repair photolyase [Rhodospirillales bacterium]
MIVSASYRTDIPAFYAPWFMNRLAAGSCRVRNPYGGVDYRVSLAPGTVDGFVFWTRNMAPLQPDLDIARQRAPFVVQFTVTGYPRALEAAVVAPERAVDQIRSLRRDWGGRAIVWRYDPVLLTSLTRASWHLANFAALAASLVGAVDEVVVSFAQVYRKTRRNLDVAATTSGFTWHDPPVDEKRDLLARLAAIAGDHAMRLTICTQPELALPGVAAARCIDAERLSDVAGTALAAHTKGNRPGCLCAESRDIGVYDSCPHGCVYCYAVTSRARAASFKGAHDPESDAL